MILLAYTHQYILSSSLGFYFVWETSDNPIKRPRASFTWARLQIRFYLTCGGTEICTVTANTKIVITTSASLSTARCCHPVTCSECHLEKPCMQRGIIPPFSTVYSHIMPASRNFLLFQKLCRHNRLKPTTVSKWNSKIWLVSISCILITSARPSLTFLEGERWSGLID